MTMALRNGSCGIDFRNFCSGLDLTIPSTQTHGAALFDNTFLGLHQINDWAKTQPDGGTGGLLKCGARSFDWCVPRRRRRWGGRAEQRVRCVGRAQVECEPPPPPPPPLRHNTRRGTAFIFWISFVSSHLQPPMYLFTSNPCMHYMPPPPRDLWQPAGSACSVVPSFRFTVTARASPDSYM